MATPMRSTDFRSIVEPILNEVFDGIYQQRADEWKEVFSEQQGIPRQYHEEPVLYGFGAAPELPDGMAVTYQSGGVLFIQRYLYKVYGLAFALTKVLVEDGDHIRIGQTYAKHLAQSLIETKETLGANILNRAFNNAFPGGDGVSLVSAAHPIVNGTFSNQLTNAAALSQTSLEQLLIQIRNAVDNNGKRIRLVPRKIVTGPANVFQAETLLKSVLRSGTADNDINPVKSMGLLSEGQGNLSRITSSTAWWIQTDAPDGLKLLMRRGLEKSMEGEFETDSMRYKATERYNFGWTDPRGVFGTAGV
tara:strand:- start:14096 stop:15010 length:915 start_codon:yes stop_codon:yes gene_type:complete